MLRLIKYYQIDEPKVKFSQFIRSEINNNNFSINYPTSIKQNKLVEIIAYCLMPTHIHLLLCEQRRDGILHFISTLLNSYTRYFNIKHNRRGPLWESRTKKVCVETDEQLLHLTRYIHLNPTTSYLVDLPEAWSASSYHEYIKPNEPNNEIGKICTFNEILDIDPINYRKFVESGIENQRDLAATKKIFG